MLPVIALVGRPNVGKSTLFNVLTKSRDALVADQPGITRDRNYGFGRLGHSGYIVVDTGGLAGGEEGIESEMASQSLQAIEEADIIFFMVDGRAGLIPGDEIIARHLRASGKRVYLVVNKTDGVNPDLAMTEFYRLGFADSFLIAASHGRGVHSMIEQVLPAPEEDEAESQAQDDSIHLAIVGRPNVGKSTLVNRLLGEERVVVFDMPGTTRDSIKIPFERQGKAYTIIDTAGVRRRKNVTELIEKYSIIKTLQAVEQSHVTLLVIDAHTGVTEQDASLLGHIIESGRAVVIAVNKWDGLDKALRDKIREDLNRRLYFINFAKIHFISALHGSGVGDLYKSIDQAYQSAMVKLSTPELTRILESAVESHQPPLVRGRRIKLRYAHQGGKNPPIIVIHGNQTESVPDAYKRYLVNFFRKATKISGTPIRIEFKSGKNPYHQGGVTLTDRQAKKRRQLKKSAQHK